MAHARLVGLGQLLEPRGEYDDHDLVTSDAEDDNGTTGRYGMSAIHGGPSLPLPVKRLHRWTLNTSSQWETNMAHDDATPYTCTRCRNISDSLAHLAKNHG